MHICVHACMCMHVYVGMHGLGDEYLQLCIYILHHPSRCSIIRVVCCLYQLDIAKVLL